MLHPPRIPKCCQHPRSRRARRPPFKGSFSQFRSCKESSSSTTTTSTDQGSDEHSLEDGEDMSELSLFKWNLSWKEDNKGIFSNSVEVPVIEVESVTKISSSDSSKSGMPHATWSYGSYSTDRVSSHLSAGSSPKTADKSLFPAAGNMESWLAPGNVVWAKTSYHEWWPAECLEERSKNPLEAFQDALKQALSKHARTSSRALSRRCSGEVKSSSQNDTCADPSNSSRMKDDDIEEGRGKRKRKMKIHFDELSFPEKPPRRVRRLRIMRYLGLIAPVGSPFSPSHVRTA
ncbi:uncharacterized protein LOC103698906 isoform X2 [Phoenix dactylifera]|uniref:Uncharacterized protein LOC103698906 isoform X2 n=1 Tax=Phoenix dactylifera TaxID=42345 RepID=A0A8B7BK81_PHODC|nr:uncharacterized protein LOC103698906 isoform X2 [Phoenix dactylifera]